MTEAQLEERVPEGTREEWIEQQNQRLERYLREIDFDALSPEEILRWTDRTFPGRAVINTSFQYSGVTMIHMARTLGLDLRIATIDTLRLHPETHEFIEEIQRHYQCRVEIYRPDPREVRSMIERFGEYLFFDSRHRQEYCCQIRKARPNRRLLKTVDCWISGLRRDQSAYRRETVRKAGLEPEYGTRRKILKLNPLVDWSQERLLRYIEERGVLTHPLYEQGYPSFGCTICATPIGPGEDRRAGRWRWFNAGGEDDDKKECGLHLPVYNI